MLNHPQLLAAIKSGNLREAADVMTLIEGEWKKHKYIRKEDKRYIYPDDVVTSPNIHDFPHKNNVLFVTGRSGSGKTSMAQQMRYQLKKSGINVHLFNLDTYWKNPETLKHAYSLGHPKVTTPFAAIPRILQMAKREPKSAFIVEGVQLAYPGIRRQGMPVAVKRTGLLRSWYRGLVGRDDLSYLLGIINRPTGLIRKFRAAKSMIGSEIRAKLKWHRMINKLEKKYDQK